MTLTAHFAQELGPLPDPFGKSIYPAYAARADGLGFDLYPLSHLCGHAVVSLGSVYHDQRDLVALAGDRPTFQWLETGSLEGACGAPVTPAAVHAEAWLAIAGGARGIGYFTYGWPDGKATSSRSPTTSPPRWRGRACRSRASPGPCLRRRCGVSRPPATTRSRSAPAATTAAPT